MRANESFESFEGGLSHTCAAVTRWLNYPVALGILGSGVSCEVQKADK